MESLKSRLTGLASTAALRAGINTGNKAIVTVAPDGSLSGPALELAQGLAAVLGLPLEIVRYDRAPAMAEDAPRDLWDICFLGHDPDRAHILDWSRPYVVIEALFATKLPLRLTHPDEADQPGRRIHSVKATAYDLHLARSLRQATLVQHPTFAASVVAFRDGGGDVLSATRAVMEAHFATDPAVAMLQTPFATVGQAIAVPVAKAAFVPALNAFLDQR